MIKDFYLKDNLEITVIGDAMLDKYIIGSSDRISPEAPVPVVKVNNEIYKPGGAANVAVNLSKLGCKVNLISLIGKDQNSKLLKQLLKKYKINFIFDDILKTTITKTRVLSHNQQLLRIDNDFCVSNIKTTKIYSIAKRFIKRSDAIIMSDYQKGALQDIQNLIKEANKNKVNVFIDPKSDSFEVYKNSFIVTPNRKEFEAVVGKCLNEKDIIKKARVTQKKYKIKNLLITLGSDGMILVEKGAPAHHIQAIKKEVYDVTGAGDTVISILTACSSSGISLKSASEISNIAAGEVISKLGSSSIDKQTLQSLLSKKKVNKKIFNSHNQVVKLLKELKSKNLKIGFTNGCFDLLHSGHTEYLNYAKSQVDYLIVGVNDDKSVKRLKGKDRPINKVNERMKVLSALNCIDMVIKFTEDTPIKLIKLINPNIIFKGGDYRRNKVVGYDQMKKTGGSVSIVPYAKGKSSSNIINKMKK